MTTRERRAKALGIPVEMLPDGRGRHGNHARAADHPRWNSEQLLSSHGYVLLRVGVDHPLANPNGYAYEHLVVWVAAGRALPTSEETIHHRNEDKTDNRLANLECLTRSEHALRHDAERGRDDHGRFRQHGGRTPTGGGDDA